MLLPLPREIKWVWTEFDNNLNHVLHSLLGDETEEFPFSLHKEFLLLNSAGKPADMIIL